MKPVPPNSGRVTIQDIADRLGISKATVSRALLERARVAPKTREEVLKVAQEMGYRPDPALRALSNLRWSRHPEARVSYRLALLNMMQGQSEAPRQVHSPVDPSTKPLDPSIEGAINRARDLGFQLDFFEVSSHGLMRFGDVLFHRGYDGILFGVRCPTEEWKFPYDRFPCVAISFDHPSHRLHQVTSDWFTAVSIAVREVLARGYKRLGFTHYVRGNPSIDQRTWAAMLSHRERLSSPESPAPSIFVYRPEDELGDAFYDENRKLFLEWYEREKPDVIIDGGFLGYWFLRDAGLRMPEDVGHLRLRRIGREDAANISAVDHNLHEQGRWAVDLLYSMMQTGNSGMPQKPARITVSCGFFEGMTLRPQQ